ncbi:dihydrodipicolinate synthase family protein [Roseovarius sp. MMSF_3281]|uniref:dihydrodipicolinate synthase family protein n=1 Tax=Roseovarius sp. MMSF_3281 TaxID=3046694 RepID=UPI00273D87F8|nr:dihydrodipicolinate synthase family protein [Roseovarius sp. MMSF_3281]
MSPFQGLSAFPITPCDSAGKPIGPDLSKVLKPLVEAQVSSIGLLGSTGTYAYLSRSARRTAIEIARDCLPATMPLIVGVGALRTDTAQHLAEDAAKAGADALLLAPVSYTPLTEGEAYDHFVAVADTTDLPLCIYNNPGTTHFTFSAGLLARLALHPRITGAKMPLPAAGQSLESDLSSLRSHLPSGFDVGYSGDWGCAQALKAGADAWYSVAAGLFPAQCLALTKAAQSGDHDQADRVNDAFAPMWELFQTFGSLRVVYAAAQIMRLTNATPPLPLQCPRPDTTPRIKAAIDSILSFDLHGG